jgi:GGDEF domain-containing protein
MILLPGASHIIARSVAERLQSAISLTPETLGETKVSVTICSGTVSTDQFATADSEELVSLVSAALSTAQKLGPNSIAQADPLGN